MNARRYLTSAVLLLGLVAGCEEGSPIPGTEPSLPPANPASFSATAASSGSITLTWSAVEGVSGYTLERRTAEGAFSQIATPAAAATQYLDEGLGAGIAYTYRIRAVSSSGSSSGREASAATEQVPPPANPANFLAWVFSTSSIGVTWHAVEGVSGYTLERRAGEGAFSQIATPAATETHYRDEGLSAGTSYTYRIRAVGSGGSSSGTETSATTWQPAPGPNDREPYVVKGRVLDAQGSPLANVQVFADNTFCYNCNVIGVTDEQGNYRIELPRVTGSYLVTAQGRRVYHGRTYRFDPHVDDNNPFAGAQGAVRNFEWRLTGDTHQGFKHGGTIWVYSDWQTDRDRVELTFTPDGPLIDGSTGQVLVRMATGGRIDDMPIGRYRVTARYLPTGEAAPPIQIRLRHTQEYLNEVTALWPVQSNGSWREMELEVREES